MVTVSNLDTVCGPGGVVTVDTADTVPYGGPHVKRPRTADTAGGWPTCKEVDMSKVTTSYQPHRYRHRPTVVEGIVYDGSAPCARAIVDWARERTGNSPFVIDGDDLHAMTRQGTRYVPVQDLAVLGVKLEPYSVDPEVREAVYVRLGVDYGATPLTIARVRELADEARHCPDRERLRSIVAELAALGEALLA